MAIDMHTKDARARGETEQRLYALNALIVQDLSPFLFASSCRPWSASRRGWVSRSCKQRYSSVSKTEKEDRPWRAFNLVWLNSRRRSIPERLFVS